MFNKYDVLAGIIFQSEYTDVVHKEKIIRVLGCDKGKKIVFYLYTRPLRFQ